GPDFTADYLHRAAESLVHRYSANTDAAVARAKVAEELKRNTFNAETSMLIWTEARAAAHRELVDHYATVFRSPASREGGPPEWIPDSKQIEQLTAFFAWTAWTGTALRPERPYSYTNNWPPEPLAGNTVTADAVSWSVISIIGLLGGAGVVLYFFGRYDW